MGTRCLGGVFVVWGTKLLISSVKSRIFCPKTSKFGPKLTFLFILGQALPAHLVPFCRLWRGLYLARHLYFIVHLPDNSCCDLQNQTMKLKIQFFVPVQKFIDPQPELLNVYSSQDELLSVLSESGNFLGDPLLVRKKKI